MRAEARSTAAATCADAVARALQGHGVEDVFLLAGAHVAALAEALDRRRIRLHAARHEQGCAFMAMGYALAGDRPGVCLVVPGPGLLNATAALATAHACNVPVLCLVGQIESRWVDSGAGVLHELDGQLDLVRTITRWRARIDRPADAVPLVDRAFAELSSSPEGPVVLELPLDVAAAPEPAAAARAGEERDSLGVPESELEAAAAALSAASAPLVLAGSGAARAEALVLALAERLGAPVVATVNYRARASSTHPLVVHPLAGRPLWRRSDAVLAIGTRALTPLEAWGIEPGQTLIRLDADPERLAVPAPPDVALLGDARDLVPRLLDRLGPSPARPGPSLVGALNDEVAARLARMRPEADYLAALESALAGDALVAVDSTQLGYYAMYALDLEPRRRLLTAGYMGTLGSALPLALGAKAAAPRRQVLALCGDGGFMFAVQELATAVQQELAVTVLVVDDGGYGEVRRVSGEHAVGADLVNPDFRGLAASFGIPCFGAGTPAELGKALRRALAADTPALVHVPVELATDLRPVALE